MLQCQSAAFNQKCRVVVQGLRGTFACVKQQRVLQNVKRWAVAVGLLLLLLVPVLLTSYKTIYATPEVTQGSASTTDTSNLSAWECTGNFSANDVIMVEFLPNIFWAQNPAAFDVLDNGTPVLYVDMNITDPKSNMSQYELWLTYDRTNNRFSVINVTALSLGEGINSTVFVPNKFTMTYTFIAGTAKLNGTYFANVTFVGFAVNYRANGTYKPAAFELFYARTVLQLSQPYASLLYVGYAIIPAGAIFLVYGVLKRTKPTRKASSRDLQHSHAG